MILSLSSRLQSATRVFNKTRFLLLLIYGSALKPEINSIDLQCGHISHVVTSVCYLLVTILNIKYKFLEFKSSCNNRHIIHVSHCGINPVREGFQNTVCACLHTKDTNESSRLGWLIIAHWFFINFKPWLSLEFAQLIFLVTFPCFFPTPSITFVMVRPSVLCVKSRLLFSLPVIVRAVKSPLHGPSLQTFC